jgi:hypothetical protein
MDGHRHEGMSDETLEREIEAALGVDPSPEFLPRIRARIASERVTEGWLWPGRWQWAGAAIVVIAVAVIAVWTLREPAPAPRGAQIANAPTVEAGRRGPELLESSSETPKPVSASVIRVARSTRRAIEVQPDVVVSPDEAVALRQLVAAIAARQVEAADIPDLGAESVPLPPLDEIVLEPIKLSPIVGLEGE